MIKNIVILAAKEFWRTDQQFRSPNTEPYTEAEIFACIRRGLLDPFKFAEAYAAAVSKNLQEELAKKEDWRNLARALKRILELEKEITALRLELSDRDRQIKGLTEDVLRLIEQAGKSPR